MKNYKLSRLNQDQVREGGQTSMVDVNKSSHEIKRVHRDSRETSRTMAPVVLCLGITMCSDLRRFLILSSMAVQDWDNEGQSVVYDIFTL